MSPRAYQSHQITCEICGQERRAQLKGRDICRTCLRKEPYARCVRCGHVKHDIDKLSGLCPRCTPVMARPVAACTRCVCSRCNRLKVYQVKAERLCKQCYKDHLAPQALRSYVERFTTIYPYNMVLFDLLTATIDWPAVTQKTDRKFRAFGHFFQIQPLSEPLTWETLEHVLPPLGPMPPDHRL